MYVHSILKCCLYFLSNFTTLVCLPELVYSLFTYIGGVPGILIVFLFLVILSTDFILISVQLMWDAVLFVLALSTVLFFLALLYHGVFSGPISPNMLVTGIQLTLVIVILKVFMDIRYGESHSYDAS